MRLLEAAALPTEEAMVVQVPDQAPLEHPLPPPRIMQAPAIKVELQGHTYLANGLLQVNPRGRHPIYDLITRSEREWEAKLARQSRTLPDALNEYKRRYGRAPPMGFDRWWAYVQRHGVQLPDEYDQIMRDLESFWGMAPRDVRRMQSLARGKEGTYNIASSSVKGKIELSGTNLGKGEEEKRGAERAKEQLDLLHGFGETWTDERTGQATSVEREIVKATGDWEATFNLYDVPREFVSYEWDSERRMKAQSAAVIEGPQKAPGQTNLGWAAACPPNSHLRYSYPPPPELPIQFLERKTFIHSHRLTMNPCSHSSLVHLSGVLLAEGRGPEVQEPALIFGSSTMEGLYADILTVPTQGWVAEAEGDVEWEEKLDERLLWRGSTTGVLFSPEHRWAASQRIRFMEMVGVHDNFLNYSVLLPNPEDTPVGIPEPRFQSWMNALLTDAAFVRGPVQCTPSECDALWQLYEFRSYMPHTQQYKYKYLFDVDGNGRSVRFERLMRSRSLVLKASIFPEWYSNRIQPWVHYVPVQLDLSDLYDILTFFRGDVGRGGEGAHDELARKIAYSGKAWAEAFWRKEDMVAYVWRLMLEYSRVGNDAREYLDFEL
ncbi:hypothetical protein DACRYDRAFT_69191 [Dacryopinax primogenitus]|uniref:Glycosyl transferase CAP10 domain-containing protein n=1 Tax=Dacryopinax primogenitus (strain DJM 731) TaxID=1858805 RepID=M5G0Y9_DACPD|nr:uncharacterized protein DACRYDRAFT_69191 [Dacryopinax primogenitus]EJT99491.1 hypothetical protein DACRYDRAFT_69191 [Dacryopinax primogenitus]